MVFVVVSMADSLLYKFDHLCIFSEPVGGRSAAEQSSGSGDFDFDFDFDSLDPSAESISIDFFLASSIVIQGHTENSSLLVHKSPIVGSSSTVSRLTDVIVLRPRLRLIRKGRASCSRVSRS